MEPMPFLSSRIVDATSTSTFDPQDPEGEVTSLIPLSKVQQTLWLDYLRRPAASHYHLTLKIDLSELSPSIERILQVIHLLGSQHAMLRTTFHIDSTADDIEQSYMAVHSQQSSIQNVEIVSQASKLHAVLRSDFKLSSEFPVRWVISQDITVEKGVFRSKINLYVVGHHIAIDGSSMSFLSNSILRELEASNDTQASEAQSCVSYGNYVQGQNAYLRGPAGQAAKNFWLSQISHTVPHEWTVPAPTAQSTDYRKMNTWAFFPNEELTAWSQIYKTSWFRIAVSIVSLVAAGNSQALPHHDHTLQIAFGARQTEYRNCVSHMANTVNATFGETVKQIGKSISTAKKHEMFPFISLLEEARKTMNDNELQFKVAVTFSPKLASKKCVLYPVEGVWDLFFCFLEQDDGVSLGVIINPQVFDSITTQTLQKQFLDTVRLSQETTDFHLLELPYLHGRETAHIIQGPDITAVEEISSSRIHKWIKARAIAQPNALALYSAERDQQMTYAEMDRRASQIAQYLSTKKIKPSDAVLLHMERGFDLLIWILGTLKCGGCYVVLDKALPISRKQAILRVAEAVHFVTDTTVTEALFKDCSSRPGVTKIDEVSEEIAAQPDNDPPESSQDDDLAYIVFTSGSTGQPKGVMVEHQNLSHYVSAARSVVKIGLNTRVLQFASFSFDASVLEWAVSLSYGATICFVNHPALLVGDYLADVIDQNKINFFHTTPSILSTIPWERRLPTLRMLSVGGEASSAGLLGKWGQRLQLLHAYGPTETTVIVTVQPIAQATSEGQLPSPSLIGKPFPNSEIWICGNDNEIPLPVGETGEICIIGPQVTLGYKGQDELTASKFRTIEHSGRQVRLYRTGDGGFLNLDGTLSICGRLNNREIKLRGYRIDLAEVEKSILDHSPEVMVASVQVDSDSLVAFVVPETVNCSMIRERLAEDIPSYSIPKQVIALSHLPLNANGKVDHAKVLEATRNVVTHSSESRPNTAEVNLNDKALALPNIEEDEQRIEKLHGALEQAVIELWVEVLGLEHVPRTDITFFEAGGHSILLTALHKRITSRFPESGLRLLDIFQQPTIERQVNRLFDLLDLEHTTPSSLSPPSSPSTSSKAESPLGTSVDGTENVFAIVGMAGRFPGADNVEEYWNLLLEQRDGITTMKESHPSEILDEGEIFVPRYGSINGLKDFNPEAWNMTAEQAQTMDPQKRIFLDVAREALSDAGLDPSKEGENSIGVFVGAAANTHQYDIDTPPRPSSFENRHRVVLDETISTFSSYKLNLTGPNMTLNTACSSSLVALHQGLNALTAGDCDCVLVGGTSIVYPQKGGYITSPGKVFAASGVCRPFDERSDGSVPSDAVAAVVVKPLHVAIRDGNAIYAIIEGHAIGTDGNIDKIGFEVPSSSGQSRTIYEAIRKSGIDTNNIKYIEMHGSGTKIGDALELEGLCKAFDTIDLPSNNLIHIGSNKGNCGNSETASGLMSLIKVSLALSHGVMPPLKELDRTNPLCDFENSRFRPLTNCMELAVSDRVGVTSLGYGGTNAHCILSSPKASNQDGIVWRT